MTTRVRANRDSEARPLPNWRPHGRGGIGRKSPAAAQLPSFSPAVATSVGGAGGARSHRAGSSRCQAVGPTFLERLGPREGFCHFNGGLPPDGTTLGRGAKGQAMTLWIQSIGTAVPEHSIAQEDAAATAALLCGLSEKQRRLLPTLYRHAGVQAAQRRAGQRQQGRSRGTVVLSIGRGGGTARAQHGRTHARLCPECDAAGDRCLPEGTCRRCVGCRRKSRIW